MAADPETTACAGCGKPTPVRAPYDVREHLCNDCISDLEAEASNATANATAAHPPAQVAAFAASMNRLLGDLGLGTGSISPEDAQRIITEVEHGR